MRHTLTFRRSAAAAVSVLALSALAACGGDTSSDPDAADPSTPAASTDAGTTDPVESESASPEAEESTDAPEEPEDTGMAEGSDLTRDEFLAIMEQGAEQMTTAHVKFEMGGQAKMSGEGDIDYTQKPPALDMSVDSQLGKMRMILVDNVMYMQQPGEDKYIKMDLDDPNSPFGSDFTSQMDPSSAIRESGKAIKSVTLVGEEDVDGVAATHYTVVVDGKAQDLPSDITQEVWVDADNRMLKTTMDFAGSTYEGTISGHGEPVEIVAPPADQVVELPS